MSFEAKKLQAVLAIVNQHLNSFPFNKSIISSQQFRKLVIKRMVAENILVFLLQFIGLKLTSLIVHPSALWFASGTSCAYLFLRGYSVFPGIWIGSFLSFYLEAIPQLFAVGYATVLTIQGLLLLWFSYLSPTLIFHRLRRFIPFIIYTMILTGVSSLMFIFICSLSPYQSSVSVYLWLQWWLANFNGILIFSCAFVTWDAYFPDFQAVKPSKNTILLFGLLLFIISSLVFSHTMLSITRLLSLIALFNVLISLHFGWCGAIAVSFLLAIILCLAALMNAPVFYTTSTSSDLLLLPLFLSLNSIAGLSLTMIRKKAH